MNWIDVPSDKFAAWQGVFNATHEGITLEAKCPVCGSTALHRYFSRPHTPPADGHLGRCGLWEWCSSCRSFAHYSAAMPNWWHCDIIVDESILTPEPEALEAALINAQHNVG